MTQSGHSDDGNASIRNRQLVSAANCLGVGEGMPHDVNRLAPMSIREPVNGGSSAADNRDRGANAGLRHMSLVAAAQVPHHMSSMESPGRTAPSAYCWGPGHEHQREHPDTAKAQTATMTAARMRMPQIWAWIAFSQVKLP
jgi:hypothetical protein